MEKIKNLWKNFINIIKKKWLISGTKTVLLVAILVGLYILATWGIQKLDLTPIDLSQDKAHTLSDESKEKIAKIDKQVNAYFIGFSEDSSEMILAKQYNKVNQNIIIETVDLNQRKDIADKYGLSNEAEGVIVECGDNSKWVSSNDFYDYDYDTQKYADLTEQKITSAILRVSTDDIPNVCFLEGYNDKLSLNSSMAALGIYMQNEILNVNTIDILKSGKVSDECDTLVIATPSKDFEEKVATAIIDYINKGGNILWFNASIGEKVNLPNVNKVLAAYGIEPFEVGFIMETDKNKTISGANYMVIPEIRNTEFTSELRSTTGVLLIQPTPIKAKEPSELEKLKVERTDLLITSEKSFFRTDFKQRSLEKQEGEQSGEFVVGALFEKTVKDAEKIKNEETGEEEEKTPAVKSKLIIYGENLFVSSNSLSLDDEQTPFIMIYKNKDLALSSVAYLAEREQNITVKKATNDVKYTATQKEDAMIKTIIFTVPIVIFGFGIVVWQVRRRQK